jgi:uncharacterized protein (DUF952 family)
MSLPHSLGQNLYKICPAASWSGAQRNGRLPVSPDDQRDGFVHLSTARQVRGSLRRHFAAEADLVLLEIPESRVPIGDLRWEPARSGELFPHLYAALVTEFVARVIAVPLGAGGHHELPPEF